MLAGEIVGQFVTEKSLGSSLIRWLTSSEISHVDLVVPESWVFTHLRISQIDLKVWMSLKMHGYALLGARLDGGVRLRPWNYAQFTRVMLRTCTIPNIDAAYSFAFAQIGKPYNWQAILDFILHKLHLNQRFDRMRQRSWFCDELFYSICAAGGVQLLDCDSPESLTPQMVLLSPALRDLMAPPNPPEEREIRKP